MNSIDDIFMVSDSEEEDEHNELLGKNNEASSLNAVKPAQPKIEILQDDEESTFQNQESINENNKIENKKSNISQSDTYHKNNKAEEEKEKKKEKKKNEKKDKAPIKKEESETSPNFLISENSENSEKTNKQKNKNKRCINKNNDPDLNFSEINSQIDYSEEIDQLRRKIDDKNRKFEAYFEDLTSKHSEELAILKQNNLSKEQSLSTSYDLEYRNIIWATTLHHLKKGCFSDNIGLLFQQAINDEQFQLEKELIELKQKYNEEIDYYRSKMPKERARKIKIKKRKNNISILTPKEMASMINNKFISQIDMEDFDLDITRKIDILIKRVQKESQYITINEIESASNQFKIKTPVTKVKQMPIRSRSPKREKIQREYLNTLKQHQKACNHLQKSVKKTDRYIKEMQENDWFQEMFPHVE